MKDRSLKENICHAHKTLCIGARQIKIYDVPKIFHTRISRGFTIIELMVVLAIAAVLLVLALGNITGSQQQANLQAAAEGLSQNLKQIRERALAKGVKHNIVFNSTENTYTVTLTDSTGIRTYVYKLNEVTGSFCKYGTSETILSGPEGHSVPADGITFANNTLIFEARGGAQAGAIYITNDKQTYAIVINALGRTRIYVYGKDKQWH
jgi:prepilin-type N-terminal cleavage/methylation domain-containing protein